MIGKGDKFYQHSIDHASNPCRRYDVVALLLADTINFADEFLQDKAPDAVSRRLI
jgi:hypothetical protein